MSRLKLGVVLTVASGLLTIPAAPAWAAFADVPSTYWDASVIKAVAIDHDWMRDYGTRLFRPALAETREQLARALVRALQPQDPALLPPSPAPSTDPTPSTDPSTSPGPDPTPAEPTPSPEPQPDPHLVFTDLPASSPYYAAADLAVRLGWMTAPGGVFRPTAVVKKYELDLTLLNALGLQRSVAGLRRIATADGASFGRNAGWAALAIASEMRLHFNHPSAQEKLEIGPSQAVPRSEVAYSLLQTYRAKSSWTVWSARRFESVVLPAMTSARRKAVAFAFNYVGYPYVYAGEWYRPTTSGYCCGAQPVGGFDCSGFSWWTLKAPMTGWAPTVVRSYRGWSLPQRSSFDMARRTTKRIVFRDLLPMDVMLFRSDLSRTDYGSIDHAGLYLGNGWMIHSSGGRAGVTLSWAGDGWWRDHFVFGRRVIP
jgi:cell wall-associated NlpC family hydrolase